MISMQNRIIDSLDHADFKLAAFERREPGSRAEQKGHLAKERHGLEAALNLKIQPAPRDFGRVHTESALTASSRFFFMVKTRSSRGRLNMLATESVAPHNIKSLPLGIRLKMAKIAPKPLLSIKSTLDRSSTKEAAPAA